MPLASFPATKDLVPMPILRPVFGSTVTSAVGAASSSAVSVKAAGDFQAVRIHSIDCDMHYIFGASDVAAATATGGYVPKNGFIETYMLAADTHIRVIAKTGTGSCVVELLQ